MPIEILMPALSPTMTEGNLTKWLKKEGEQVAPGDIIAEIETDKATMEVEAVESGIIAKIFVDEGSENVKVNQVIALIIEEDEEISSIENYKKLESTKQKEIEQKPKEQNSLDKLENDIAKSSRIFASPLAKRIALNNEISLADVKGTGSYGRIVKCDIINYKNTKSLEATKDLSVSQNVNYIKIPHTNMRKIIAKRLCESKQQVPHFYLTIECKLDKLLELRQELNSNQENYKLSVNDFVIKASAQALRTIPAANAAWSEEHILQFSNIDISVAVAIDSGLITPIIKNADLKSLSTISNEMKDLAMRARSNKLAPHEFQGGNFSISNLGMYGIKNFNAIINPPQACILAVGAGLKKAIIQDNSIQIATIMEVTLSVDHRVVDGVIGAEFLNIFRKFIENPILMLV